MNIYYFSYDGQLAIQPYVICRLASNFTVYNGTDTPVAYSEPDRATYAILLTYQGGSIWSAAIPDNFPLANWLLTYYDRTGSTPVVTDVKIASEAVTYNGAYIAPTPPGPTILSPYALTTLAAVEARLPNYTPGTSDDVLVQFINAESILFEGRANNQIAQRRRKEFIARKNGDWEPRWVPAYKIEKLAFNFSDSFWITYSGSAIAVRVEIDENDIFRIYSTDTNGNQTTTEFPFATYKSTSTLCSALSGWGLTVKFQYNVPTDWLYRCSAVCVKDAIGPYVVNFSWASDDLAGVVLNDGYIIGWNPKWVAPSLAIYWSGLNPIPDDITDAVAEAVKVRYNRLATQFSTKTEKMGGDYSFTIGESEYPEWYWNTVQKYSVPIILGR